MGRGERGAPPPEPDRGPSPARRRSALAAGFVLWCVACWPLFQRMKDTDDYVVHLHFARQMIATGKPHGERFGFELLSWLASGFAHSRDDLFWGAVVVSVLAMACKWLVSVRLIEREVSFGWSLTLASVLMLLAPITLEWTPPLKSAGHSPVYLGQISGLVIHNPTTVTAFALAVLLFDFSYRERYGRMALVGAAQCLIKPNFVVAWLPVFGLLALWRHRSDARGLARAAAGLAPIVGVLAFQFLTSKKLGTGFLIAPFVIWNILTDSVFVSCVRSLAFPALFTAVYFREVRRRGEFWFAWAIFGVAFAQYALILVTGPVFRGDWAWGRYFAVYIVFLLCLARFADICSRPVSWEVPWRVVANAVLLVLLALHLQAGVVYFVQGSLAGQW